MEQTGSRLLWPMVVLLVLLTSPVDGCGRSRKTHRPPECKRLNLPAHGASMSCTNGNKFGSMCQLACVTKNGYAPARGANARCHPLLGWELTSWECEDTKAPVFLNCPRSRIVTRSRRNKFRDPIAKDNSGYQEVKQIRGQPLRSTLGFGVHLMKFTAKDRAGHIAECVFIVEVKKADCPKPTSRDKDMRFTCSGLTVNSVCRMSCESGSFIEGSKYISCVQSDSDNIAHWEPVFKEFPRCFKKSCPQLNNPNNGALACDKQLGGTVCQLHCDGDYDVKADKGREVTFFCGSDTHRWKPSNQVPDCSELAFPDVYFLPTEFFYFWGDCNDPATLTEIKTNFLDNLAELGVNPCLKDTCTVDDVDVTCGEQNVEGGSWLDSVRKRRDVITLKRHRRFFSTGNKLRIRVTFHLKNRDRTISPQAASTLLQNLAKKSQSMLASSSFLKRMYSKAIEGMLSQFQSFHQSNPRYASQGDSPLRTLGGQFPMASAQVSTSVVGKTITGQMDMTCAKGHVTPERNSSVCMPCAAGTSANERLKKCQPCSIGTYQDVKGSTSCKRCPSGHTTINPGATSRQECLALCPRDKFSPTGTVPCFPCPVGTFQSNTGGRTCNPCSSSRGQGSRSQCQVSARRNLSSDTSEMRVSKFLLACGANKCLSF